MRTAVQETSIQSYREHRDSGRLNDQQRTVMLAIHRSPNRDWSLQELSKETGIAVHVLSARANELCEMRYLERRDTRKCSITGKSIKALRIRQAQAEMEFA